MRQAGSRKEENEIFFTNGHKIDSNSKGQKLLKYEHLVFLLDKENKLIFENERFVGGKNIWLDELPNLTYDIIYKKITGEMLGGRKDIYSNKIYNLEF